MNLTRREFVKAVAGMGAALGLGVPELPSTSPKAESEAELLPYTGDSYSDGWAMWMNVRSGVLAQISKDDYTQELAALMAPEVYDIMRKYKVL